jgi:SAM-dependent methyltransferase
MRDNDQRRVLNIIKNYDTVTWAEHYAKAQTSNKIHNREFLTVFSNLDYDFYDRKIKALDIGCSGGRYTAALVSKSIDAVGIDTAIKSLLCASKDNAHFACASATDLPFKKDSFDLVICIELFHHFSDELLKKSLMHISEATKPQGIFVFDVKNKLNPIIWYLYKKNDSISTTYRCRTVYQMSKLIEQTGFKIIKKKSIFPNLPTLFAPIVIVFAMKEG